MNEQYEYKGNLYTKLEIVDMKDPTSRMWLVAVLYQDKHGEKFVRHAGEFYTKFKKVDQTQTA